MANWKWLLLIAVLIVILDNHGCNAGDKGHDKIYKANTGTKGVKQITRGHLNPSSINSYNPAAMKSTFVYSNAVPQYENSNNVVWSNFEQNLVTYAKTCGASGGTLYLLTGPADFDFDGTNKVAPPPAAPKEIKDGSQNKLPVPPVLWTAGCCWKGPRVAAEGLGVIGTNKQAGSVTYEKVGLNKLQTLLGGTPLFPGDVSGECGKVPAGPFG